MQKLCKAIYKFPSVVVLLGELLILKLNHKIRKFLLNPWDVYFYVMLSTTMGLAHI